MTPPRWMVWASRLGLLAALVAGLTGHRTTATTALVLTFLVTAPAWVPAQQASVRAWFTDPEPMFPPRPRRDHQLRS